MHPLLEKHLGSPLNASEVAEFLHCHITTVYRNYKKLGGVRVGSSYRFFEKSLINALLRQEKEKVDCPGQILRKKIQVQSHIQEGCKRMGSVKTSRVTSANKAPDPHGLLA